MRTVVTGPPGAGKTTYVQKNAQPGDIVFDYDHIMAAMVHGLTNKKDNPKDLIRMMEALRRSFVKWANRDQTPRNIWMIVSSRTRGAKFAKMLGARQVNL